jgi:His/Glu/Gln/Arg/opine family amino acid ABC transporter permease subunit
VSPLGNGHILFFLLIGLGYTLLAAVAAIILSLLGGTILCAARISGVGLAKLVAGFYTEIIRSVPAYLILIFVYFALFKTHAAFPGVVVLIVGLTIYHSAKLAEIIRGGTMAVGGGELEAARVLGLTNWQSIVRIRLPQGLRRSLPPLVTELTVVVKNTAIGALIGVNELLYRGQLVYQKFLDPLEILAVVGVVYLIVNYLLSSLGAALERRGRTDRLSI